MDKAFMNRGVVYLYRTDNGSSPLNRGEVQLEVLSQSCLFESFGVCKSLNSREPIFRFYP